MRNASARPHGDTRFSGSSDETLRSYGGILTGYAETFAGALNVSREAVLSAVDGDDASLEPFVFVDGNRGSDYSEGSTNYIRSSEHGQEGTDRVFIALTKEQFERLADAVGAEVSV